MDARCIVLAGFYLGSGRVAKAGEEITLPQDKAKALASRFRVEILPTEPAMSIASAPIPGAQERDTEVTQTSKKRKAK